MATATDATASARGPGARERQTRAFQLAVSDARGGLRGTAFRLASALGLVIGWAAGSGPGPGAGASAWAAGEAAWRYFGFVVVIWMALAAVRDAALRTDALIYSKPQPTERLVLARFASVLVQLLLAEVALFAGAILGHLIAGGGLAGSEAYGMRFLASGGALFFLGAASYVLALLTGTPLAGAVVGLALVLALAGKGFLAKAFMPAYTQNVPTYVLLGVALVALACWAYRRRRRGGRPAAISVRLTVPVAIVLSGWALYSSLVNGHDPLAVQQPPLLLMESQNATVFRRAPGFRLPDQTGRLISLADYPGKILVIALWSPADSDSVSVLARLEDLHTKYGARGVQPIAICLSEDVGAAATFARGDVVSYPVVEDWGTHHAPRVSDSSPLANAYQVMVLPHVVVTDRRRRLRAVMSGIQAGEGPDLDRAIQERLADEPE